MIFLQRKSNSNCTDWSVSWWGGTMAGWPSVMLLPSYTPTIALHSARTNRSSSAVLFYCPGRSEARCDNLDTGLNMLLVGCVGFTGEEGLRGTGGNVMLIPGICSKVRPPHSSLHFPSFPQEAHSTVAIYGSYKAKPSVTVFLTWKDTLSSWRDVTLQKTHRKQTEQGGKSMQKPLEKMNSRVPYLTTAHQTI